MKTPQELYPEYHTEEQERNSFYGPSDYQPILNEFGIILVQVDDDDYQGDSRVLYQKDGKYGYLQFGWGSCSGCDALQDCSTIAEIKELMDDLKKSIKWFGTHAKCLEFFKTHDWEGDYSYHEKEQREFIERSIAVLEKGDG